MHGVNLRVPRMTLLAVKGRPAGVHARGLRQKCWNTMRIVKKFCLNDLLDINAAGGEKDAPSSVLKYLSQLERAGVVRRLARRAQGDAMTSPGYVIWLLARDLGLDAPVWRQKEKVLWDPNSGAAVLAPQTPQTTETPGDPQ